MPVMGIDPGSQGSAVVLKGNGDLVGLCRFMYSTNLDIYNFFDKWRGVPVLMEKVHAIPKSSAKNTFSFGGNFHKVVAMVEISRDGQGPEFITAKSWQKGVDYVRVDPPQEDGETNKKYKERCKREHKKALQTLARSLYPDISGIITLDVADALLIAHHGKEIFRP
jgi:hypothetical protein